MKNLKDLPDEIFKEGTFRTPKSFSLKIYAKLSKNMSSGEQTYQS